MKKTKIRSISIEDQIWLDFKAKYPLGMSRRIRKLIELDIEGKLDNVSQSPPSFTGIRKVKTD